MENSKKRVNTKFLAQIALLFIAYRLWPAK